MRFAEPKKRIPWGFLILGVIILSLVLTFVFYRFDPTPQTVQKTIVFEAD